MLPLETFNAASDRDEAASVRALLGAMDETQRHAAVATGRELVRGVRSRAGERAYLDAFLQEFGLSNQEGIALMCLAEALLRVPDDATADRLIAEKLASGDWDAHAGQSESLFVNASTWGLMLTGRLVDLPGEIRGDAGGWLRGITRRVGDPLVRTALRQAMRIIGSEFVVGRNIQEAIARAGREAPLALCSFDMLGEGARCDADALRHHGAYLAAIEALAATPAAADGDPHARHSISIKLSALDPRFGLAQRGRTLERLLPRALELARLAARRGIALTVDAEEADRLEITLELFAALAEDASTAAWPGLGLAVQAYGRRAPAAIEWLGQLARRTGRRISVRLVKGAYWDSEVKRAQERGLPSYPVYTRKVSTDVAYIACARALFAAGPHVYPQFATHNAHTIGAVLALRPAGARCEFQRLHGMGQLIYDEARRTLEGCPQVRVYAPVGEHADLLAYLVRRLLENGANTSFVNRFMDERVPVEELVRDPIAQLAATTAIAHPDIPLPQQLYGAARRNSRGADFGEARVLAALEAAAADRRAATAATARTRRAEPGPVAVTNPADRRDVVGNVRYATADEVAAAFTAAAGAQRAWNATPATERAGCLERAADALEGARDRFVSLLVREAGKTLPDAIGEIREAADMCRYYAAEARGHCGAPLDLAGPTGETNQLALEGRGVFACISPWNFPLAIYTGQVVAALVTGNAVVAKPAEHTPLVAQAMAGLLHEAGVPRDALHCLPMEGAPFGNAALRAAELAGVAFTGSTAVGQWLNRALAARDGAILPLIAETGGLNAMIVDSTALPEQVVDDVVASAFQSAGQRCSALRILYLQEDVADRIIDMLAGAMDALVVGDPASAATDVGPVISARAAAGLEAHVARMRKEARLVAACRLGERHAHGSFVAPHLFELRDASQLATEQFGPLLHVVRYRARDRQQVYRQVRDSGYALTLGVQTRLESAWREAWRETRNGNTYVNRNIVGAVVGVQPFGGSGLSGTGPKAGGPHYLPRFALERTLTVNTTATGGNTALLRLG